MYYHGRLAQPFVWLMCCIILQAIFPIGASVQTFSIIHLQIVLRLGQVERLEDILLVCSLQACFQATVFQSRKPP